MEKRTFSTSVDNLPVPVETVAGRIYLIRGLKVMLASDLAELYKVRPEPWSRR